MSPPSALPRVMVAPNGARRTRADHPMLPLSPAEIVETARACHAAGADGLHAHVRDADGGHVLDAGLYRELLAEMARCVPGMAVQVTTEAAGRYAPAEQAALVAELAPCAVSVALREMTADGAVAARFYCEAAAAGCAVQHILYAPAELADLAAGVADGTVPWPDQGSHQVLYVLGRYTPPVPGRPADLAAFREAAAATGLALDWAVCAFGGQETACLLAAARAGGKMRVGFENNLHHPDGRRARDNAERVAELRAALGAAG